MRFFTKTLEQYLELAAEATQREDWSQAIRHWRKVIDKYRETAPAEAWLQLTQGYINIQNLDQAEQIASDGLRKFPHRKQTKLLILAGKIASANEDWQLASERWGVVIKNLGEKAPPVAFASMAKAKRSLGLLKLAEAIAKGGLAKYRQDPDILVELAEIATAKKNWQAALKFWTLALSAIDKQTSPNTVVKQHVRFSISILKRIVNINAYKRQIDEYSRSDTEKKVAIVTSYTEGYDQLKPPETLDPRFKYIAYTNDNAGGYGIYDIRPLPKPEYDDNRAIRYVKTHPHELLTEFEIVVWVDTSLMIIGDIYPLIKKFKDSRKPIGSGIHPLRKNIYEEFEANARLKKENYKIMKKQINFYRRRGFKHNDLAENTLLMFNLKHKELAMALETWWEQILRFSRRDQLSFNYALAKNGVDWFKLTKPPDHIRNHQDFVWAPHGLDQPALAELIKLLSRKKATSD